VFIYFNEPFSFIW